MSPLVEGSVIKQFAEKLQIVIKPFSRDTYVVQQAPPVPEAPELPEHSAPVEPKALPEPKADAAAGLGLEMPNYINVIKAWDLTGSRVHVEFAILNDTERLMAVRDIILFVGSGATPDALRFKQFVDAKARTREPSDAYRLPVILPPRSGLRLCAELEENVDVKFGPDSRNCELVVLFKDHHIAYRFLAHGNPIFGEVLRLVQEKAVEAQSAIAFTLPSSPVTRPTQ